MLADSNPKTFEEIVKNHSAFLQKRAGLLQQQEFELIKDLLVSEIKVFLHEIYSASEYISNPNQRQALNEYAEYWGSLIYEVTGDYPDISLQDFRVKIRKEEKVQKVLKYFNGERGLYIQELLLNTFEEKRGFDDTIIYFTKEALMYIGETLTSYSYRNESKDLEQLEVYLSEDSKELEKAVVCVCQAAYLESLIDILVNWLDEQAKTIWLNHFGNKYIYELFAEQLDLLEDWQRKSDQFHHTSDISKSEEILFEFYNSELAEVLEKGLQSFMQKNQNLSIPPLDEPKLADRVTRNTHRFIITLLKEVGDITKDLVEGWLRKLEGFDNNVWKKMREGCHCEKKDWDNTQSHQKVIHRYLDIEINKYRSIEKYLDDQIQRKFDKPVFHEPFTFRDIYISLTLVSKEINNEKELLEAIVSRTKRDQVIYIEGNTGSGKSTFCRKLAGDCILKHLYPLWIPILIKLRDVEELGNSFEDTLTKILDRYEFTRNSNWLSDRNTCFLFLLDGLDELLSETYTERGAEVLLKQATDFQKEYGLSKDKPKHQVLITSHPTVLQNQNLIAIAEQLEIIKIQPINQEFQNHWLDRWEEFHLSPNKRLSTEEITEEIDREIEEFKKTFTKLKRFLNSQQPNFPEESLKEPLLLYLLAAMWRDGEIHEELKTNKAKIQIYQGLLDWLYKVRHLETWITTWVDPQGNKVEDPEKKKEVFKIIVTEIGLCAIQSGGTRCSITFLRDRLAARDRRLLEPAQEVFKKKRQEDISALVSIPGDPNDSNNKNRNIIQFNHKSFSEFLYAQRLVNSLEDWSRLWKDSSEFLIPVERMDWEIYDLLGFGGLTQEIVGYLRDLLGQISISKADILYNLFFRLNDFYHRWFQKILANDQLHLDLPHKKMVQLLEPLKNLGLSLSWQEIDTYTGLNVLILLLELSRLIQQPFYPCKCMRSSQHTSETICSLNEQAETFEPRCQLLRLIGYSRWAGGNEFVKIVGSFLESINLRDANLVGANLAGAKLNQAYLSGAHLDGIDLSNAELKGAFLGNAQLHLANLSNAQLNSAFLGNANLSNAELQNAQLVRAVLVGANLRTAHLVNANLQAAYLGDADLCNASLRGANLEYAILSCANLSEANLQEVKLSGANLTAVITTQGTNLSNANLTRVNLRGEVLHDVKLAEANLNKAYLSGTHLRRANLRKAKLNGAFLGNAQLYYANLSSAKLNGAFLGNAHLSHADLEEAQLARAVLVGANLSNAHLVNADLEAAYLADADLSRANLRGANLKNANLSYANLSNAHLVNADLEAAYLADADLSRANLRGANLKNANLSCANLSEANLQGADLSGANLTAAIMTQETDLRHITRDPMPTWEWKTLECVRKDRDLEEEVKKRVSEPDYVAN